MWSHVVAVACSLRSAIHCFFWTIRCRVVILGLDSSGKTTLLYKLQRNEVVETEPTVGLNIETLWHKNMEITAVDFGGTAYLRPTWRVYLRDTHAVIFGVDATDRERLAKAARELQQLLQHEHLQDIPVLVLAN